MPVADVSVARAGDFHVLTAWAEPLRNGGYRDCAARFPRTGSSGPMGGHADRDCLARWRLRRMPDGVAAQAGLKPIPLQHFGAAALEKWLAEQGVTRQQAIVEPLVSRDLFFLRELNVPRAAFGALPNILEQEILRRTPFQLSEIWHAAVIAGEEANGVVAMCHWIVRRDRAEAALSELGLTSRDVDCLAVGGADGGTVPVITFRAKSDEDPPGRCGRSGCWQRPHLARFCLV